MISPRYIERAALVLALAALAIAAASLARPATGGRALALEAAALAARLETVVALRLDRRHDEQFDAAVGSLAAGAPDDVLRAVDGIRRARERERTNGSASSDGAVEAELAAAARAVGRIEERAASDSHGGLPVVPASALALGTAALAAAALAGRIRRRERARIASAVGHDPSSAHDGALVRAVARRVAACDVRRGGSVPARPQADGTPRVGSDPARPPATEDSPFGRLLEVVAVDDPPSEASSSADSTGSLVF